jgi:hypothetical protein
MKTMLDQGFAAHYWNAIINPSLKPAVYAKDGAHAGGNSSRAGIAGRRDRARTCSGRAR